MLWIIVSQSPLVTTLNWCGEKCVTKTLWNWRHKVQFVNQYNVSPTIMGQIPPKGLFMVKRQTVLRTCAIWGAMWPLAIWKQSWNNWGNSLIESSGWKQRWRCSKTILKRPITDKWGMLWNVSFKKSKKSSKSWSNS